MSIQCTHGAVTHSICYSASSWSAVSISYENVQMCEPVLWMLLLPNLPTAQYIDIAAYVGHVNQYAWLQYRPNTSLDTNLCDWCDWIWKESHLTCTFPYLRLQSSTAMPNRWNLTYQSQVSYYFSSLPLHAWDSNNVGSAGIPLGIAATPVQSPRLSLRRSHISKWQSWWEMPQQGSVVRNTTELGI